MEEFLTKVGMFCFIFGIFGFPITLIGVAHFLRTLLHGRDVWPLRSGLILCCIGLTLLAMFFLVVPSELCFILPKWPSLIAVVALLALDIRGLIKYFSHGGY